MLGSATPSVETAHEAERGELTKLVLSARAVAAARLPQVEIDDLAATYRSGQPSILAPLLHEKIEATLARQEQVILFLNRRAYAPFLLCRECGHQFACPRCAVSLSYSRHDRRIRCHHCDYTVVAPDICPECGGTKLSPLGIGTEKVEEAVQATFPSARVARLDRDVAQRKGALESILTDFRAEQIDILVGTQMVAKGLDFPNVTLVGVIVADVSLNLPDFRASERTFQLLTQVAGRAGRGQRPGEVVIQTFNPDHVAVVCAQTHDYLSLYDHLLQERREANYPPFCRLVNISVTGEDRQETIDTSYRVAIALEGMKGAQVLGPADATINRLQNRWRRQLLVKLEPGIGVAEIGVRAQGMESKGVMITLDVDPYNMV